MNKKYIISGGAGFIGSSLVNTLLKLNHKVICIDKLSYASNLDYIEDKTNPNFLFWHEDLINIHHYFEELKDLKVDGIFHLAASSHVDNSITNPHPFIYDNLLGTLNILELTKLLNTKLVTISTDECLGSISDGFAIESDKLHTNSVYSATKAGAELLCQAYFSTHKLNICVTRCGNNYGPRQHHEKFSVKVILNALKDIEIPVYGDGKNIRQWTYVENHIEDLINVMEHGTAGQIYHVGGGEHFINNEIVNLILEKLDKPKSLIKFVEDRKGHDQRYAIQMSAEVLRWRENKDYISFEEGIDKTIEWYKNAK